MVSMKSLRYIFGAALATGALLHPAVVNATPTGFRSTTRSVLVEDAAPACSNGATIEDLWLVTQVNVTNSNDALVEPGSASWTITNTFTNVTERLTCSLLAGYRCEMDGTPEDDSFHIWLQINLNVASFTFNQTLPCGSEAASETAYAIGGVELYLTCGEGNLSCHDEDDDGGYANGRVTVVPAEALSYV
ncbi:uncharacterized protein B0H64DRAFT_219011 [Chaetomium fimeti]|jgi:hypothetical protein|uniref:Ig-like domain-containing protein n=1 Tax=Chaetomium fimeti TaxID=1854472 RepID=A0AAE0HCD7_9PEZI|nr:hypothetical protein B0H64DRAFT_219011 [Chaetomium fimeti]